MKRCLHGLLFLLVLSTDLLSAEDLFYSDRLRSGSKAYELEFEEGERIIATLHSSDFDSYLSIESPDGRRFENDDFNDINDDARLDIIVTSPGTWTVYVSDFTEDARGNYTLSVNRERLDQLGFYDVSLEDSDLMYREILHDLYTFQMAAGKRVIVQMESDDFDPLMYLYVPYESDLHNMLYDDYNERMESRIDFVSDASGDYEIHASSVDNITGDYKLWIWKGGEPEMNVIQDRLLISKSTFEHKLNLRAGEHVIVELFSGNFDPYLKVEGPDGYEDANDDYCGSDKLSRIEIFANQRGSYTITGSSYDIPEGAYLLRIYSF